MCTILNIPHSMEMSAIIAMKYKMEVMIEEEGVFMC
jgi:hypothetical protein